MRVQEDTRQCVIFLCREDKTIVGTAFLVVVPTKNQPNASFLHLVTARHIAEKIDGTTFFIRANNKQNSFTYLKGEKTRWFYHHTDDSVDVAVAPFWLTPDIDYRTIPLDIFLSDETLVQGKIGIGDEVYITGLFHYVAGSKRNQPIVRIGNLAMIPTEPILTKKFGNIEAYLIEARSIGGRSGSPVFVRESFPRSGKHYLLGLMHGHWRTSESYGNVNIGIAVVIPAKKILEVLNHPFLVNLRSKEEKEIKKDN